MDVIDLFAGIGGFTLGLERAGFKTVAFCEIDPYAQKVLQKNWPGVPVYYDVKEISANRLAIDGIRPDIITGGFPCQDLSIAGKQAGISGARSGLWGECARLLGEIRPKYAIFENVVNLIRGGKGEWFKRVLWDISSVGYDAEWHCISASAVGAEHHRDRVWIIAYPKGERIQGLWPKGLDLSQSLDQPSLSVRDSDGQWKVEPDFRRVPYGVPNKTHRLRCLGNAVIPQIPELIGRAIMRYNND